MVSRRLREIERLFVCAGRTAHQKQANTQGTNLHRDANQSGFVLAHCRLQTAAGSDCFFRGSDPATGIPAAMSSRRIPRRMNCEKVRSSARAIACACSLSQRGTRKVVVTCRFRRGRSSGPKKRRYFLLPGALGLTEFNFSPPLSVADSWQRYRVDSRLRAPRGAATRRSARGILGALALTTRSLILLFRTSVALRTLVALGISGRVVGQALRRRLLGSYF